MCLYLSRYLAVSYDINCANLAGYKCFSFKTFKINNNDWVGKNRLHILSELVLLLL